MKKAIFGISVFLFALSVSSQAPAQTTATPAPPGTATDIKASEIRAAESSTGIVQMLKLVGINNGEYYIGAALLHRTPKGDTIEEHTQISEIYHIISGNATFETGGTLENPKADPPNPRTGPSFTGSAIRNGVTQEVGPGDVVIIPPNTPHYFKQVKSDEIVYLVIRVDPHHVLAMPSGDAATAARR